MLTPGLITPFVGIILLAFVGAKYLDDGQIINDLYPSDLVDASDSLNLQYGLINPGDSISDEESIYLADPSLGYLDSRGFENIMRAFKHRNPDQAEQYFEPSLFKSATESEISPPINDPANFETILGRVLSSSRVPSQSELVKENKSSMVDDIDGSSRYPYLILENDAEVATSFAKGEGVSELASSRDPVERASTNVYGGEYIDHPLALVGHQFVQGGAGEGKQLLGPDGSFENIQVIKSDNAVPSYCDPPNPCPIDYTAEDGCLEEFINSASFSREYQARQQCSCDSEHSLFNCASPVSIISKDQETSKSDDNDPKSLSSNGYNNDLESSSYSLSMIPMNMLRTLARTIKNRFGGIDSINNLIQQHDQELQTRA